MVNSRQQTKNDDVTTYTCAGHCELADVLVVESVLNKDRDPRPVVEVM